jgi:paraquat-inducible protein A
MTEGKRPARLDSRTGLRESGMIACRHCDLLQREVPLRPHTNALCRRCGALLYRGDRSTLDGMLALAVASAVLLAGANLFPIAVLSAEGMNNSTTLLGTVLALYDQGRPVVAAMVLVTTILTPACELAALLYMLVPLRAGIIPPGLRFTFRFLLSAHPWSMMEVFMLGILVTLIKLEDLASVVPGISLWSFVGLIGTFTAISASFSVRSFWSWVRFAQSGGRLPGVAEAA